MDLQKRTAIAVGLSILIVVIYSLIVPKSYNVVNKDVTNIIAENNQPSSLPLSQEQKQTPVVAQAVSVKTPEYKPILFKKDNIDFEFSPFGANLIKASFPAYSYTVSSKLLLATDQWQDLEFSYKVSKDSILFRYQDSQKEIIKEYKYTNDYYLDLIIRYRNLTTSSTKVYYTISSEFLPLNRVLEGYKEYAVMGNDGILLRNNTLRVKSGNSLTFNQFKWLGLRDKYFAYILSPVTASGSASFSRNAEGNDILSLTLPEQNLAPNTESHNSFIYYCGPQNASTLKIAGQGFEHIRYFGKLDGLAKFLLTSLVFIKDKIHSWGMGIIILTVVIFVVLYPLTLKQMNSMKKMQILQPEMDELRKKFKDDPHKLNKEVMELYRKHKANPLGGCLPVILQIPIFFALYQALNRGIELKGAHFLWIKDLSEPDKLFNISGKDLNLLPLLMMVTMFFQQKMSMKSMSSMQVEQQKMMLWIMPIMFGFIFYNMPSGLVLYWFVNSILMTLSQWKALK